MLYHDLLLWILRKLFSCVEYKSLSALGVFFFCSLKETGGGEKEGYFGILLLVLSGELQGFFFLNALIDITHDEALCCEVYHQLVSVTPHYFTCPAQCVTAR